MSQHSDKRAHPRVGLAVPVLLVADDGTQQSAKLTNVSLGGALVVPEGPWTVGEYFRLLVDLSAVGNGARGGPGSVEFHAQFVRFEPHSGGFGIRVTKMDRETLARLRSLIQDLRLQTVAQCEVFVSFDLPPTKRRELANALLRWRAGQPHGTVQSFDTRATNELLAGDEPAAGVVQFGIWESAYDRPRVIHGLRSVVPADLVKDVVIAGTSWNE